MAYLSKRPHSTGVVGGRIWGWGAGGTGSFVRVLSGRATTSIVIVFVDIPVLHGSLQSAQPVSTSNLLPGLWRHGNGTESGRYGTESTRCSNATEIDCKHYQLLSLILNQVCTKMNAHFKIHSLPMGGAHHNSVCSTHRHYCVF